jgi:adenylate cyclase
VTPWSLRPAFQFKGFPQPVPVYRVEQTHRMHIIDHMFIVLADLKFFRMRAEIFYIGVLERALDKFLEVVGQVCAEFAGTSRISMGDSYALTFAKRCPSGGGSGSTIRRAGNLSTG